jgi:hypothetical protein
MLLSMAFNPLPLECVEENASEADDATSTAGIFIFGWHQFLTCYLTKKARPLATAMTNQDICIHL